MKTKIISNYLLLILVLSCPWLMGQLTFQNEFCDTTSCDFSIEGIFVVWWDAEYDYSNDALQLLEVLNGIRQVCLEELFMEDPPNPGDGYYYNVYIGNWSEDLFPDGWAVGQGTDSFGYPYLTLAIGAHLEPIYQYHEGFHVFQYNGNSPGFSYGGDSAWFVEASANWFVSWMLPDEEMGFLESAAIEANPQLPMWYDSWNAPPDDPQNWQRGVHPYAMNAFLYYLTENSDVPATLISTSYYSGTLLLPQEYLAAEIGIVEFQDIFADWAAHNVADFDYISLEQLNRARIELEDYGDPMDLNPIIAVIGAEGTNGQWLNPQEDLITGGWSYNVFDLTNINHGNVAFYYQSSGGEIAQFRSRMVVRTGDEIDIYSLNQINDHAGFISINITSEIEMIKYIVAAVPDHYTSNQIYPYEIWIETGFLLGDVNRDELVNILDIMALLDILFSNEYDILVDINLDNSVNILDIIVLINIILGSG